jgi:hypothetical protein
MAQLTVSVKLQILANSCKFLQVLANQRGVLGHLGPVPLAKGKMMLVLKSLRTARGFPYRHLGQPQTSTGLESAGCRCGVSLDLDQLQREQEKENSNGGVNGSGVQFNSFKRWGDYSSMSVGSDRRLYPFVHQ